MSIRFMAARIFIMAICISQAPSCSPQRNSVDPNWSCPPGAQDKLSFVEGCWFDDNSYRIIVNAAPSLKSTEPKDRRDSAKRLAVIMAGAGFIEYINNFRLKKIYNGLPQGTHVNFTDNNEPAKVFSQVARKGSLLHEAFDIEQNCRIIYEIHEKGLRQKVKDYLNRYR